MISAKLCKVLYEHCSLWWPFFLFKLHVFLIMLYNSFQQWSLKNTNLTKLNCIMTIFQFSPNVQIKPVRKMGQSLFHGLYYTPHWDGKVLVFPCHIASRWMGLCRHRGHQPSLCHILCALPAPLKSTGQKAAWWPGLAVPRAAWLSGQLASWAGFYFPESWTSNRKDAGAGHLLAGSETIQCGEILWFSFFLFLIFFFILMNNFISL